MLNRKLIIVPLLAVALLAACNPEKQARDTSAALKGALTSAQAQYKASCQADPTQSPCALINRGVDAQNALVTSIQTYCGWSALVAPDDPNAVCKPVKGADASAVKAALSNAAPLTREIKGVIR